MADYNQKQGDDITLSITVGTDVNIDNLAELFVYIVNQGTKAVLAKFSKAGTGGFTALAKVTTTNYTAIIPSGTTKDASGTYIIEGNVAETDADYESSEENTITCQDRIIIKASVAKASSSG